MKSFAAFSTTKQLVLVGASIIGLNWSSASQAIELGNGFGLDLTLTALSDYRDTGISQTQGDPALQAEATLNHESGVYVGVFTSNIDFGTKAYREDMYYVGVTIPLSEEVYIDTYIGRYEYPNEAYGDFNEFYAQLAGYGFQLDYTYDFDFRGHLPNATNISLGYNFELPYDTGLLVRYGHTDLRFDALWSGSGNVRQTYNDWEAKLSKDIAGVNVFASYVDTDLSDAECYNAVGYDDVCSATLVLGASKTF